MEKNQTCEPLEIEQPGIVGDRSISSDPVPGLTAGNSVLTELSGWGRYPRTQSVVVPLRSEAEMQQLHSKHSIARGLGRSYGDAAILSRGDVWSTSCLAAEESLDQASGRLTASAGQSIDAIISKYLPLGWFPPVVPGTRSVTLGGCIAADVHGKNHHRDGSFIEHVNAIRIMLASGDFVDCSPNKDAEIFWSTSGGMGLTGVISKVELQLKRVESAFVIAKHVAAQNLYELMECFENTDLDDHYSVAWIDCATPGKQAGRGIFISGHHATAAEAAQSNPLQIRTHHPLHIAFAIPGSLFNRLPIRVFNQLYFLVHAQRRRPFRVGYQSFFFPLDTLSNWNRLYGDSGLLQYQCVIPTQGSKQALDRIVNTIAASEHASTLAVLKKFRPGNPSPLSFPIEGYTLALDFPVRKSLFPFLDKLDEITLEYGGRVYLAKDARLNASTFRRMYPRLEEWKQVKRSVDPHGRFVSDLSRRLELN